MGKIRKASWFPALSVLLMAVFLQAQAAGCCKLGVRFLSKAGSAPSATPAAGSPSADAHGMAGHACCRKAAAEPPAPRSCHPQGSSASPGTAPVHAGGHSDSTGCCLEDAGLNASGLVSIHAFSASDLSFFSARAFEGLLPRSGRVRIAAGALDSGPPPASRSNLPLLI